MCVSHKHLNFCKHLCAVLKLNNCFVHKRTCGCLGSSQFLDRQQDICVAATSLSPLSLLPPPPPLQCVSCIAPSFFVLPVVTRERKGALTSTPTTRRTSSRVSQLTSANKATKKNPRCALILLALSPWWIACITKQSSIHHEPTMLPKIP